MGFERHELVLCCLAFLSLLAFDSFLLRRFKSGNESDHDLLFSVVFILDQSQVSIVEPMLYPDPLMSLEKLIRILYGIDSRLFFLLYQKTSSSKNDSETLDCLLHLELLESLNVYEAFNLVDAANRSD